MEGTRTDHLPTAGELRERHARLLERLRSIAARGVHDPARLRIVGITKTWPIEVARSALEAGIEMLGENRVQEALPKVAAVPDAEWHMVGRLQSNKARAAVQAFEVIHSVDSTALLSRLDGIAHDLGRTPRLLLQVNVSGEATKSGMAPDGLKAIELPRSARLVGLMTMAPEGATEDEARAIFGGLRALRDQLQQRLGIGLPELSMGMSADAEAAAAEGATLVRIGTALFGSRA
ncbi:MAG TPA: YggS family pyridoxal phosphate-dependent enzyme [Candidatus Limnocylindria bacterium]|nr:YggS family pyridoxal phosphate-dependent enzyme [Candidatus Limnocylindria bacterium]